MKKLTILSLLTLFWLLASCQNAPAVPSPTAAQINADTIRTAAAQTAVMRLTELIPSATPAATQTPTETLQATLMPDNRPTQAITTTQGVTATPSITPSPVAAAAEAGNSNGVFVKDVNIPDNTAFNPGASFTKTWQFLNNGQTTWTQAYELVFISGDGMGGPASVKVPLEVAPNQVVDISVNLVAPQNNGTYKGFWRLRSPGGKFFGDAVYVQIVVGSAAAATPDAGGLTVSNVMINVDNAAVSTSCPHKFMFTTSFTLNAAAAITYQLEAGGFEFSLPQARTETLSAGTYTFTYELEVSVSGNGWARMHITAPVDAKSSDVAFSLTCQP